MCVRCQVLWCHYHSAAHLLTAITSSDMMCVRCQVLWCHYHCAAHLLTAITSSKPSCLCIAHFVTFCFVFCMLFWRNKVWFLKVCACSLHCGLQTVWTVQQQLAQKDEQLNNQATQLNNQATQLNNQATQLSEAVTQLSWQERQLQLQEDQIRSLMSQVQQLRADHHHRDLAPGPDGGWFLSVTSALISRGGGGGGSFALRWWGILDTVSLVSWSACY